MLEEILAFECTYFHCWTLSDVIRLLFCLCLPLVVSDVDYIITESGLQRDQPPTIGDPFSLAVVILKNDNSEGILEFKQDYVDITGQSHSKDEMKLK